MKPFVDANHLVWMDLEMTGLDPENCRIIEMATLTTNSELEILAEGPVIAIHQSTACISAMDEWNTKTHGESGLIDRVKASAIDEAMAEQKTLDFIAQWVPPGRAPLCGNSIGQDRRFLYKYMPKLSEYLHYRNIDVSSVKELVARWYPHDVVKGFKKQNHHQALADIRESIGELRYYRQQIFKTSTEH